MGATKLCARIWTRRGMAAVGADPLASVVPIYSKGPNQTTAAETRAYQWTGRAFLSFSPFGVEKEPPSEE